MLERREESAFAAEQIGYLTKPVDVEGWVSIVRSRFGFLADLDAHELRWAQVNEGHRWAALQAVDALAPT